MERRNFLFALALLGTPLGACAAAPDAPPPSVALGRPRLLASAADWSSLDARRKADPDLDRFAALLLQRARRDLALPPLARNLEGRRLLGVSREFIRRTLEWSFAWRVTRDPAFLARARQEFRTVAAFADWNPSHFLDVAEMTAGMAIGYDWLFDDLPAAERAAVRAAILEKGIAQARHGHATFRWRNNWSQVCIGGMVLGAMSVYEDAPELARDLFAAAQRDVFSGLVSIGVQKGPPIGVQKGPPLLGCPCEA